MCLKPRLAVPFVLSQLLSPVFAGVQSATYEHPKLTLRSGAPQNLVDVSVSPGGKWYATLAADGKVTIWSTTDGFQYRTFPAGDNGTLAIASDDRTIATAQQDQIQLWDVHTTASLGSIGVNDNWKIQRLAFHPSRMIVASLDVGGNVRVRSTAGPELFSQRVEGAQLIRFSPDGSLLAVASPKVTHVFSWEHKQEIATFDAHAFHAANLDRKMQAMVISPSGSGVRTQTAEQIGLFDLLDVAFSSSSSELALVHKDEVTVVDIASHKILDTIPVLDTQALTCVWTSDSSLIVGLAAKEAFRYDMISHTKTSFPAWTAARLIPIPGTRELLIQIDTSGASLGIRDLNGSTPWTSFSSDKLASVSMFQFSPDGQELISGNYWATAPMTVWDLTSGEADQTVLPLPNVGNFAVSADGQLMAYYGQEGYPNFKIHVWNRRTRTEILAIPITTVGNTQSLAFSPDGTRLAALIGQPKATRIWSIPDGRQVGEIPITEDMVQNRLAWNRDNRTLAISQRTGVIVVDAPQSAVPQIKTTIDPQKGSQFSTYGAIDFSPAGDVMAVGGTDGIFLFETKNWSSLGKIQDANGFCVAFSPDSKRLLYNLKPMNPRTLHYDDKGIYSWDIASAKSAPLNADTPASCLLSKSPTADIWAAPNEGGIGIVSGSTGQLLATLYQFGTSSTADWLVITPDGLFDGTPGAWNQMSWRFSSETFNVSPVEIFFQNFYHPGLLAEICSGHTPKANADITKIDVRQPTVTVSPVDPGPATLSVRSQQVNLKVQEAPPDDQHRTGSGVRELRLFRNGVLVQAWHGDLKLNKSGGAMFSAEVPIVAGDNHFTAYAFSISNIKSNDAVVLIKGSESLRRKGIAWIISVGVDHYDASTPTNRMDLRYAESDATDFSAQFKADQDRLKQFSETRTINLFGPNATRTNLEAVFQLLKGAAAHLTPSQQTLFGNVAAVQPEDGVFLFYAGHGSALDKHFYMIPRDYDPKASLSDPRSRAISDTDLSKMLEDIAPARSFIIIDACNSGQVIDSNSPVGPTNSNGLAQLAYEKGIYVLAASKDSEPALEAQELGGGHGFLTYALIEEGLKQNQAARNGIVELRPWFMYADRRVPELQAAQLERRTLTPTSDYLHKETRQHPRVFYRREPESSPFLISAPEANSK